MFLENLDSVLQQYLFEPYQIYNCDETGLTCVRKPSKVIVSSATSGEKGVTATVLCAVSAAGHYVPPLMIFKRKRVKPKITDNAPVGTIQGYSENGWVNTELFIKHINHFVKFVIFSEERKVLLIFDGHKTHTKSLELIDYARDTGVVLISLLYIT